MKPRFSFWLTLRAAALPSMTGPALQPEKIGGNITPPSFIASAVTDKFTIGALHYTLLLREKRVPVGVRIYGARRSRGRHP